MFLKYWNSILKLGHSRTVIGIEEKKNKTLCLLLFDPGCPSQEMQKLLKQTSDGTSLKLLRKFLGSLKEKQYQIVAVGGVLSLEEKAVSILENSFCLRKFKRICIFFNTQMHMCIWLCGDFFFFNLSFQFSHSSLLLNSELRNHGILKPKKFCM